jgi:hypothetical protein
MPYEHVTGTVDEHGVRCPVCGSGWYRMTAAARAAIGTVCRTCSRGTFREYHEEKSFVTKVPVCRCGSRDASERQSLGIYAGVWCDRCWEESGYRKEGPEGFDPLDAGEAYGPDDY